MANIIPLPAGGSDFWQSVYAPSYGPGSSAMVFMPEHTDGDRPAILVNLSTSKRSVLQPFASIISQPTAISYEFRSAQWTLLDKALHVVLVALST